MDRGDVQWMEGHTSDDIVWHTGGNSRAAGVRRGKVTEVWGLAENDAETDPIWDAFAT